MNTIILVVWLQMLIVVALNVLGDTVVNTGVLLFCKFCNCKRGKPTFVHNLSLFRYIVRALSLRLLFIAIMSPNLSTTDKP